MLHRMAVKIDWAGHAFPAGHALLGTGVLHVKFKKLVRASVTIGRWPFSLHGHGSFSSHEIAYRASVLRAYFAPSPSGRLVRSSLFPTLDPTEKAMASYFLGSALAKVVSQEYLDTPHLMHVSRYWDFFGLAPAAGSVHRPDYVGPRKGGGWVVVEAKARRRVTTKLKNHAKNQKNAVTINGAPPALAVASIARLAEGGVSLALVDPDGVDPQATNYSLDSASWLTAYYGPILQLLREQDVPRSQLDGRDVRTATLVSADLRIGLDENTWERATSAVSDAGFDDSARDSRQQVDHLVDQRPSEHIGTDGVVLELGPSWRAWDDDRW